MVLGFRFRESDAQRKARLIKKDREYDEEKRKAFQNEEEDKSKSRLGSLKKKVGSAYSKYESAEASVGGRISGAKASVEGFKERRALSRFKREEEHDARLKDARTRAEVKIYGRELSDDEREKFAKAKEERKSRPSRIERFSKGIDNFNTAVGRIEFNDSVLSESVKIPTNPDFSSLLGKPVSFGATKKSKKKQRQQDPLFSHLSEDDPLHKFWLGGKKKKRADPFEGLY
jgi:hypothetical protein